jgi:cytochrome b involved in lipid metabolism
VIIEYAGSDATVAFMDKGHSKDAYLWLSDCYIGNIIKVGLNIYAKKLIVYPPTRIHTLSVSA